MSEEYVLSKKSSITDIANKLREVNGLTDNLKLEDFIDLCGVGGG